MLVAYLEIILNRLLWLIYLWCRQSLIYWVQSLPKKKKLKCYLGPCMIYCIPNLITLPFYMLFRSDYYCSFKRFVVYYAYYISYVQKFAGNLYCKDRNEKIYKRLPCSILRQTSTELKYLRHHLNYMCLIWLAISIKLFVCNIVFS